MRVARSCASVALAFVAVACASSSSSSPAPAPSSQASPTMGGLLFEENTGRYPDGVRFVARGGNGVVVVDDGGFVVVGNDGTGVRFVTGAAAGDDGVVGDGLLPTVVRHYRKSGSYAARAFSSVVLRVADGVDVVVYGKGGELEYDWRFAKGVRAVPALGVVGVDGGDVDVEVDGGDVVVGGVRVLAPRSFVVDAQGRASPVASALRVEGGAGARRIVVDVGAHDVGQRLVVDPLVRFQGSVGGSASEMRGDPFRFDAPGVGVDVDGNVYVSGTSHSPDLPTTEASFQRDNKSGGDAFVGSVSADGKVLRWITYVATGAVSGDEVRPLAVDHKNNQVALAVRTDGEFPATAGSFQPGPQGNIDVGVIKFKADGGLVAATFFGGAGADFPYALTVDDEDGAVIVGGFSTDKMPVTPGALRPDPQGLDGFVGVLTSDLSRLEAGTLVGGDGTDIVLGLHAERGLISVAGQSDGGNFMGRPEERAQGLDAFALQMSRRVDGLRFAHLVGGGGNERGFGVDVGADDGVYLVGNTTDIDAFPFVGERVDSGGGGLDGFVARFASDGEVLRSIPVAGNGEDQLNAVVVLDDARVVVGGSVRGTDGFVVKNGCASDGAEQGVLAVLKLDLTPQTLALLQPPVRNLANLGGDRVAFAGEFGGDIVVTDGSVKGGGGGDIAVVVVSVDGVNDDLDCIDAGGGPPVVVDHDGDFINNVADVDDDDPCVPDLRAGVCNDVDNDGLGFVEEQEMTGTDPLRADTDGDGLGDRRESYEDALFALKCITGGDFENSAPCGLSLFDRGRLQDLRVITLDDVPVAVDGLAFSRQRQLFAFAHSGQQSQLVQIDRASARARVVGPLFDGSVTGAAFLGQTIAYTRDDNVITVVMRDRASGGLSVADVDVNDGSIGVRREVVGAPPQLFVAAPFDVAVDHHGAAWLLTGDAASRAVVGVIDIDTGFVRLERPFRYDNSSGGPLGLAFDVDEVGVVVALDSNGTEDLDRLDLCGGGRTGLATNLFPAFNAGNTDLAQVPHDNFLFDDDNDGVPTAFEFRGAAACNDADGDGLVDADDNDADDDGLVDGFEDVDADGVVDPGESDPRNRCDPDLGQPGCALDDANGDCIVDVVADRRVDPGTTLFLAGGSGIFAFDPADVTGAPLLSCSSPNSSSLAVDVVEGVVFASSDAGTVVEAHDAASLARVPDADIDTGVEGGAIAVDATGRKLYRLGRDELVVVELDNPYGAVLARIALPATPIGSSGSTGIADGHALAVDVDGGFLYVALNEHEDRAVLRLPLFTAFRTPTAADLVDTGVEVGLTGGVGVAFGAIVTQDLFDPRRAVSFDPVSGARDLFPTRSSDRSFSLNNLSFSAFRDVDDVVRFVEVDGLTNEAFVTDDEGSPQLFTNASGRGIFAIGHVDGDAFAIDRDDDGASDLDEFGAGTDPDDVDTDDDGVVDGVDGDSGDVCVPDLSSAACDADGDGVFGEANVDSDNDGVEDPLDDDDDNDRVLTIDEGLVDVDGDGVVGYLDPSERGDVVCGDGAADCVLEECDDGNTVDGDGCDSLCQRDGAMAFRLTGDVDVPECQRYTPNGVPDAFDDITLDAQSPDFSAFLLFVRHLTLAADYAGTVSVNAILGERVDVAGGALRATSQVRVVDGFIQRGGSVDVDTLFVAAADDGAVIDADAAVFGDVRLQPGPGGIAIDGALVVGRELHIEDGVVDGAVEFRAAGNHEIRSESPGQVALSRLIVGGRATVRPLLDLTVADVLVDGGVLVLPRSGDVVVDNVVVDDGVFAPGPGADVRALVVGGGVAVGSNGLRVRERFVVDGGRFLAGLRTLIGGGDGVSTEFDTGTVRFDNLVFDGEEVVFSPRSDLRVTGTLTASGALVGDDEQTGQWSILAANAVFPGVIAVRDSLNLDVTPLLPAQFIDLGNNTRWGPQANPPACADLDGVFGPVVLVDDAAVAAFNASGVQCIDGDLEIGADVTSVELDNLVVITGTLRVRGSNVTAVVLPVLTTAGAVDVGDNDALETLSLPALTDVLDSFVVDDNDALETLNIPVIENIGGDLVLEDNDALTDVDAPALSGVGGDLVIDGNDNLDSLGLAVLVDVGGNLQLVGNPDLAALLLPLLEDIGGTFSIVDNDALVSISVPSLEHVGGDLVISENDAIDSVDLPPDVGFGGVLDIEDDVVVVSCGDGVVAGAEECDDDNAVDGDGCGACVVEPGFVCGGAPSVCARDLDGDGVRDDVDVCAGVADDQADNDGDHVGDACDADDDNAGGGVVGDGDADGDGVADDVDNCVDVANNDQGDVDGDGDGDACDDDADGDGVVNDPCPLLADEDDCALDEDGDGVADEDDGCPVTADDGSDVDGDGKGDACDADDDDDGAGDAADNCVRTANAGQEDADDDGRGDACDACVDVAGPRGGCPLDAPVPEPDDGDVKETPGCCAQFPLGTAAPALLLLLLLRRRGRNGLFLLGFLGLAGSAQAATFTGAVDGDANNGANWDGGVVPSDVAVFPAGAPPASLSADLVVDSVVIDGAIDAGDGFIIATDVVVGATGTFDGVVLAGPGATVQVAAGGAVLQVDMSQTTISTLINDGEVTAVSAGADGAAAVVGDGVVGNLFNSGVVLWGMDGATFDSVLNSGVVVFDGHDVVTRVLENTGVLNDAASITVDGSGDVVLGQLNGAPALTLVPRDPGLSVTNVDVEVSSFTIAGTSAVTFVDDDARVGVADRLVLRGEAGAQLTINGPVAIEVPADVDADHLALRDVTLERGVFIDPVDFTDLGGNHGFGAVPAACGALTAFVGDVVLATDDDVAAFEASAIACVDGDVVFGRDVVDAVLTHLTVVTGRISIRDGLVQQVAFTALVDAGAIDIAGNDALTDIDLPVLVNIDDDLFIGDNDALEDLALPALAGVGGDLVIDDNDALVSVDAGSVASVGGDLVLDGNDALADVVFTVLAIVNGDVVAIDNDTLIALLLEALAEIGGSVVITNNTNLEDVGLDAVTTVGGDLQITDNDEAADVDLQSLQSVGGALDLDGVDPQFPEGTTCDNNQGCHTECGDALIRGNESCDDGNVDVGDGCSDRCVVEPGFVCDGPCRRDGDRDGIIDDDDPCALVADDGSDLDQDGIGDACDVDDDGDGRADIDDDCPEFADADHRDGDCAFVNADDTDGDGIANDDDACAEFADASGGCGDVDCADAFDCDGDGIANADDLCATVAATQTDDDGDGLGDDCDSDDDGDGVPDAEDACPKEFDPTQACGAPPPPDDGGDEEEPGCCAAGGAPFLGVLLLLLSRRRSTRRRR